MPALDHIGVAVRSYEKVRYPFVDVFGTELLCEGETGATLWAFYPFDNIVVELSENHDPEVTTKRLGGEQVQGRVEHWRSPATASAERLHDSSQVGSRSSTRWSRATTTRTSTPPAAACDLRVQNLNLPARL